MDIHWMPFYDLIFPCRIRYDFIGKIEHLDEDAKYILRHGFSNLAANTHFPQSSRSMRTSSHGQSAKNVYDEISKDHIEKLKYLYRYDFEAFGYDPEQF